MEEYIMKTYLGKSVAILIASVAVAVEGAPPATTPIPPLGGTMTPGAVGGQMSPGAPAGVFTPDAFYGNPSPGGGLSFSNSIPGGTLYLGSNGIFPNLPLLAQPGAALGSNGIGGAYRGVIVAGGNATNPPGAALNGGGVGGAYHGVIVAGGNAANPPGAALSGTGVGGAYRGVIVAGGNPASPPGGTLNNGTTAGSGGSVIVAGGSSQ
jgi:hypothetical protein